MFEIVWVFELRLEGEECHMAGWRVLAELCVVDGWGRMKRGRRTVCQNNVHNWTETLDEWHTFAHGDDVAHI